ncbi:lipid A deacylase LpxR family protein, partial [Litoreibacter sp.]|nr:lipid A deacylase LpxR family protein [Litoreibacter sp.]
PTLTFEASRDFVLARKTRIRPFIEVQAGAETLARIGADVTFGGLGRESLLLRDAGTGQRYVGVAGNDLRGLSLILGGDIAYVADSRYLATPGIATKDLRTRLRAGYHRGWRNGGIFYGVTYLGKEFEAQREGQLTGSVALRLQF